MTHVHTRGQNGEAVIRGWVAPGFDTVKEQFERNFMHGSEVGAAFSATQDGEPLVDLWEVPPMRARTYLGRKTRSASFSLAQRASLPFA